MCSSGVNSLANTISGTTIVKQHWFNRRGHREPHLETANPRDLNAVGIPRMGLCERQLAAAIAPRGCAVCSAMSD